MGGIFHKGLMLFFGLALCFSMAAWLRVRQELQVVTAANESLRKTLGDLTVAITGKDREINRLAQSPCGAGENLQVERGSAARRPALN